MRLVGHLRALEDDVDGLVHFVGPILENVQAGSRLVIVAATLPTSTDAEYQVYASAGPPEPAPFGAGLWDRGPIRLGKLDGGADE